MGQSAWLARERWALGSPTCSPSPIFETYVVEPASAQIAIARATIERAAADGVRRGKLDSAGVAASTERLHFVVAIDNLPRGLDLIVESGPSASNSNRP